MELNAMRKLASLIASTALVAALSCAPQARLQAEGKHSVEPAVAARDASRADEIEKLLSRHMTGLAPFEVRRAAEAVIDESAKNRLDPHLVLAVMHTESGFYNFARSSVGALGLMQIMPATGEMLAREAGVSWSGPDALFAPETNVRLGTRYLALLHARYGSWQRALAAYNWGPAALDKRLAGGDSVPQQYVQAVYARLEKKTSETPRRRAN
jgi:soluble lytic murein transglycosylase